MTCSRSVLKVMFDYRFTMFQKLLYKSIILDSFHNSLGRVEGRCQKNIAYQKRKTEQVWCVQK